MRATLWATGEAVHFTSRERTDILPRHRQVAHPDRARTEVIRAATIVGPRETRIEHVERLGPGPSEVQVAIEGCGLSARDLRLWEGTAGVRYPLPPGAPGHEAWGTALAVGENVRNISVGDPVVGVFRDAFAEETVLPAKHMLRAPLGLMDDGMPAESLGGAINAFHRADIREGDEVAVVGVGFVGAILIQLCAARDARVVAISRRPYARKVALRMGAHEVLDLDAIDLDEAVRQATDGHLADRVFETTGHAGPLDAAARLTGVRGRLVIVGHHDDGPRNLDLRLWNRRGFDIVNAHDPTPEAMLGGMRRAFRAIEEGRIDVRSLITHRFRLDRLDEAFDTLARRPDGFLKAIVVP